MASGAAAPEVFGVQPTEMLTFLAPGSPAGLGTCEGGGLEVAEEGGWALELSSGLDGARRTIPNPESLCLGSEPPSLEATSSSPQPIEGADGAWHHLPAPVLT